jgi:hypothetical protein
MTIKAATQKIKVLLHVCTILFTSVSLRVGVSLSGIKNNPVTIIGSKQPGIILFLLWLRYIMHYFLGGGPGKNGSYRNIELLHVIM